MMLSVYAIYCEPADARKAQCRIVQPIIVEKHVLILFDNLGHAAGKPRVFTNIRVLARRETKRSTLRVLSSPYVHPCTVTPPQVCTAVVALSCDAYQVQ